MNLMNGLIIKINLLRWMLIFFVNLYSAGEVNHGFPLKGGFPKVDRCLIEGIGKLFTVIEIEDVIFNFGAFKAPRVDGLNAFSFIAIGIF